MGFSTSLLETCRLMESCEGQLVPSLECVTVAVFCALRQFGCSGRERHTFLCRNDFFWDPIHDIQTTRDVAPSLQEFNAGRYKFAEYERHAQSVSLHTLQPLWFLTCSHWRYQVPFTMLSSPKRPDFELCGLGSHCCSVYWRLVHSVSQQWRRAGWHSDFHCFDYLRPLIQPIHWLSTAWLIVPLSR